MTPELWSIMALVAIFVIGTTLNINLGVLAITATFLLASTVAGVPLKELYPLFPGDMFILLVALMFLLSLAKATGAIEWFVRVAVSGSRGRIILIPWMLFALAAATSALGPSALPLLAGIGVTFARRYNISKLLLALMIIHGTQAGGFSPVTPYSVLLRGVVEGAGYAFDSGVLFVGAMVFNTIAAVIGFSALGGWKLIRRNELIQSVTVEAELALVGAGGSATTADHDAVGSTVGTGGSRGAGGASGESASEVTAASSGRLLAGALRPTSLQVVTLIAIIALVIGAAVLKWDLASTALVISVILAVIIPAKLRSGALDGISWSAVVLLCGMLLFMALLQKMGTITYIVGGLQALGSGLLALLIVCYIAGIVSAVASSFATLAATVPIALALLSTTEMSGLGVTMVATAIVVSSTIVDISPFSLYGALVLGAAEPEEQNAFQKMLLKYAAVIVVLAPAAAWATLVVPAWLLFN